MPADGKFFFAMLIEMLLARSHSTGRVPVLIEQSFQPGAVVQGRR